ncbi:MAG: superoxide dismutase [Candidatus Melainabacteria bacterium]
MTALIDDTQTNLTLADRTDSAMDRRDFLKMAVAVGGSALALHQLPAMAQMPFKKGDAQKACEKKPLDPTTVYQVTSTITEKPFANLSTVEGISPKQLEAHLALYKGYVSKINDITGKIKEPGAMDNPRLFRALHIDQSFALNGALLHQLYFENMGGGKSAPSDFLKQIITMEFGSWEAYLAHVRALGQQFRGWVITGYNMLDHRIHNYGLDSHNEYYPAYVMPILALDVYEHAYMIDFGTKRDPYLDAFLANVNWAVAEDRLTTIMHHCCKK